MTARQKADALLEALCAGADPRKAGSLRLIHTICTAQQDRGSADYSIATIGRLSAERGGPAAGAIRNKTGEAYRALIKTFADGVDRKAGRTDTSQLDLILEGVTDPVLRARLGLLLAELKATRAQLLAARHLANHITVLDLEQSVSAEPAPIPTLDLSPLEIRALDNAVSTTTLEHWGWQADKLGRILTDTGRTVFAAGFVTAIGKILKFIRTDQR